MFFLAQNYLNRGFWGDEAWTSLISQLPYVQMLKTTAADFHPPGYYTIIELLYKFLPPTEINTRLVSIFFYLATIFMVWRLASYVKGHVFGVLSALVVALNPIFFTYAFEARNYTMFAFAATGSIFFLLEISKKFNWFRALGFVLFTALGVYTHYYMFFILGAQGLYLLLFDRKIFIKMMGLYVIVGVLFLPWLPFLYGQLTSVKSSYWIPPIDFKNTYFDAFERILGGEAQSVWRTILFGVSLVLLIGGLIGHLIKKSTDSKPRFEKPYILIWLWVIVPFVLASLPGLSVGGFKFPFRPIFFWRYLIGASIPLSMVMVHGAQKAPKQIFMAFMAVLILFSAFIDFGTFSTHPYSFREAYQEKILPRIMPNDKIVTFLPSFAEVLYYRNRNNLKNDLVVSPEGLVQFSGKSLLDSYAANGTVTIDVAPKTRYFNTDQGQKVELVTPISIVNK
jgi:4-amino-4-deoxy-L-arabinose transferase-like glycosyltransferase